MIARMSDNGKMLKLISSSQRISLVHGEDPEEFLLLLA
jgi:hypothetical protein